MSEVLVRFWIGCCNVFVDVGDVVLDGPALAGVAIDEARPAARAGQVSWVRFAVQQLVAGIPPAHRISCAADAMAALARYQPFGPASRNMRLTKGYSFPARLDETG